MTQSSSALAASARQGRVYPWIFVAAFLGIIAVNATMVTLAVRTFSGVETPKHYVAGLAYNQALDAARAQAGLGWQVDVLVEAIAANGDEREIELSVRMADAAGASIDGAQVRAVITRPTRSGLDRDLVLSSVDARSHRARVTLPLPGAWDVRVVVNRGVEHWQRVQRISVP
jgi:nitrogen fixation protein FixH